MADQFRRLTIVKGSDSISLDFGLAAVVEYKRMTADYDGVGQNISDVNEGLRLAVTGRDDATVINQIQKLEQWLFDARRRQRIGADDRVFIHYKPSYSDITWRAEIKEGKSDLLSDLVRAANMRDRVYSIGLAWTRRGDWLNASLSQLPLSNVNASRTTSPLTVYNSNDLSGSVPNRRVNYIDVAAADIGGAIATPVYLEITNNAASGARRLYIAQKVQGDPDEFQHILEAENAVQSAYAVVAADATCSNGQKSNITNVPTAVATVLSWTLSALQASYILSQWIRPVLRFATAPTNSTTKARFTLRDANTNAMLAQGPYQDLNSSDALQVFSPHLFSNEQIGQAAQGPLKITLDCIDSAGTCDFSLDYLELAPVEASIGFRYLKPIDESLVNVPASGAIVDNQIDDSLFIDGRQKVYSNFGGPLLLVPNKLNRFIFSWDMADASAPIANTLSVRLFYRQRALVI